MKEYYNKYKRILEDLKEDLEEAIDFGEELNIDEEPDTEDYGRYITYKYVLDFINYLEKKYN